MKKNPSHSNPAFRPHPLRRLMVDPSRIGTHVTGIWILRFIAILPFLVPAYVFAQQSESGGTGAEASKTEVDSKPAETIKTTPEKTKPAEPPKAVAIPPGLRPYHVHIALFFSHDPRFSAAYRDQIKTEIANLSAKTIGQMWDLDVQEQGWLSPRSKSGLERLTEAAMLKRFGTTDYDKVFLLTIDTNGTQLLLDGLEWDIPTRRLGRIESFATWQRHDVARQALALAQRLFQPLLVIERVIDDQVDLLLRAGEFPAVDPQMNQIQPGDLMAPVFRYLDKKRVVRQIQFLPWTYLIVESVERNRVSARIISGLRRPLGSRRRRHVELMAVLLRPTDSETTLKLVLRNNPTKPLIGHQVDVISKTFPTEEAKTEPIRLISDRQGTVSIHARSDQPLVWVYIRSGKALLSRVPYVPGVRDTETFQLVDDSMRLRVEAELEVLKGRVIDTVAKRMAHVIRARNHAGKEKWEQVDAELARLKQLPGVNEFERQLRSIRVPAVERAQAVRNISAKNRIEKLCKDTKKLINIFLAESAIADKLDEIQSMRP